MSSEAVSHPEGGAGIKRRPADGKKVLFARIRIETYQQILALAGINPSAQPWTTTSPPNLLLASLDTRLAFPHLSNSSSISSRLRPAGARAWGVSADATLPKGPHPPTHTCLARLQDARGTKYPSTG